jgi:hypothetical protein
MARTARFGAGAAVVLGVALTTVGCTPSSQPPTVSASESQAWGERMDVVLRDPSGLGGASGLTPGSAELGVTERGDYELVAACIGVDVVHVTAKAGGRVLADTDVPCGATVTVPMAKAGSNPLEVRATAPGGQAGGAWWVGINHAGWKQSGAVLLR